MPRLIPRMLLPGSEIQRAFDYPDLHLGGDRAGRMDAFCFPGGCVPAFGGGWDEGGVGLLRIPD